MVEPIEVKHKSIAISLVYLIKEHFFKSSLAFANLFCAHSKH